MHYTGVPAPAAHWPPPGRGVPWEQQRLSGYINNTDEATNHEGATEAHDLWWLSKNFLSTLSGSLTFAEPMSLAGRNLSERQVVPAAGHYFGKTKVLTPWYKTDLGEPNSACEELSILTIYFTYIFLCRHWSDR